MLAIRPRRVSLQTAVFFFAVIALLIIPLAGCYDMVEEVIPAAQGDVNPYRSSEADMDDGGKMYFSPAGTYNDTRYRSVDKDGKADSGTFRLLHITADVYAVQVIGDSDKSINLLIYRITPSRFSESDFADENAAKALAARYNVKLDVGAGDMSGSASDIFAFLRASSSLTFK